MFIQIFAPKSISNAMDKIEDLAILARDSFRSNISPTGSNIWLRNSRIEELSPESKWLRFNVTANYTFDEVS